MFTIVYSSLITYIYQYLLVFTYVYSCFRMYTHVYSCLPMFTHAYLCLPLFTHASLPMFTSCLPKARFTQKRFYHFTQTLLYVCTCRLHRNIGNASENFFHLKTLTQVETFQNTYYKMPSFNSLMHSSAKLHSQVN